MVGIVDLPTPVLTPFGRPQNALPLDAIVRAIEIAAGKASGGAALPDALQPQEFVLL